MSEYLKLNEAAALLPGRPHTSAVWRWAREGVRARNGQRIRLSHVRVGRNIYVTREAVDAFLAALNEADLEHFDAPAIMASARDAAIQSAETRLTALGM